MREVFYLKQKNIKELCIAFALLAAFALWTIAVCLVDVESIGPLGSSVGFAALNGIFHRITGVHMTLYIITDWLGLVPFAFALGFAVLGFVQLCRRKSILKVDFSILALGGFYALVIAAYAFFEICVINYRPVLIEGYLEVSYPSSTTMLVMTVIPTAIMQFNRRVGSTALRQVICGVLCAFIAFMVIGRLVSGVHWLSDIIGGALLSAGLVMLYHSVLTLRE